MRRREFIVLLSGAAAGWPLAASAQQPAKVYRIAILSVGSVAPSDDPITQRRHTQFFQTLEHLGWTKDRNLRVDHRWYGGDADRARAFAKELVSLGPDAILVMSSPGLAALRQETQTTPIVFVGISDPVGQGFVASLAHPGGNMTGFVDNDPPMGSKWLELLKEIAPGVARVAFIFNPKTAPLIQSFLRSIEAAGSSFQVKVTAAPVFDAAEIERAITAAGQEPNGGLIVAPDSFTWSHRELIIALAAQQRLPAVYSILAFVKNGGLLFYGVDLVEQYGQAAIYVDRILRGAKPGDLPVQAPTKFSLIVNLKTAKELGITIPPSIMVQADEVIE
jgi:putative ABC transport system substrate-binding protein